MREIKVRGKRLDNNEWVYGVPIKNSFGKAHLICIATIDQLGYPMERLHEFCFEVDHHTVGQYIGRKNEGDEDVFEFDVASVILQDHVFGFYRETEYIGIVKYDETECVYCLDLIKPPSSGGEQIPREIDGIPVFTEDDYETNRFYFSENIIQEDIHILGNIYDNPELLGGRNHETD
ncbi:YopX family protein [Desemzia sp. FAM 23990]|uniref:YopX family protein n=1 Tax=Desemzia sp. FAM 23990 TaxID=3259520 RepID=UPI00388ABC20